MVLLLHCVVQVLQKKILPGVWQSLSLIVLAADSHGLVY